MIFSARKLQQKFQEMRTHLHTNFVNPTKAFDTVNHDGLWKLIQKFGCHEQFTPMARQLHEAPTRMFTTTVHDLLFANDCAINTVTEEDMQRSMDLFTAGCADFGLTISTAKMVVMRQLPPSAEYNAPRINVNGAQLKNVETFAYLGRTQSRNTRIDDEVPKGSPEPVRHSAGCRPLCGIAMNTEVEMGCQDPGHGHSGADQNPQHPRHAEASATVMERPPALDDDQPNHFIEAPPSTITDTIVPPQALAPNTANTSATTLVKTSYLPPASYTITIAPRTSVEDSVLTRPHCDRTSAWSVTCVSIARRPVNLCQRHQHKLAAPDSTVRTAHAHSHYARAY
ncbi:unnamed protein product [Schistocephalus solidus]|uniref:Reverse transcriptase domain-containing protein n=1 Tax=Schistocephalus solidus TaxID=70667 RepID=A0A183SGP9_SCHSO|nr:unnamed protein product [Schistocephalus solidus]